MPKTIIQSIEWTESVKSSIRKSARIQPISGNVEHLETLHPVEGTRLNYGKPILRQIQVLQPRCQLEWESANRRNVIGANVSVWRKWFTINLLKARF